MIRGLVVVGMDRCGHENMGVVGVSVFEYDAKDVSARERPSGSKRREFEVQDRLAGSATTHSRVKVD